MASTHTLLRHYPNRHQGRTLKGLVRLLMKNGNEMLSSCVEEWPKLDAQNSYELFSRSFELALAEFGFQI